MAMAMAMAGSERPMPWIETERALKNSYELQTPTLLDEARSWHARFVRSGSMRPD